MLRDLTVIELRMICLVLPLTCVYPSNKGGGGQLMGKGHAVTFYQDVGAIAQQLPRNPSKTRLYMVQRESFVNLRREYRPSHVEAALVWLKENNPFYRDIKLDFSIMYHEDTRPEPAVDPLAPADSGALPPPFNTVEAGDGAADDDAALGSGPAHDTSSATTDVFIHADDSLLANQEEEVELTVLKIAKSARVVNDFEEKNVVLMAFPHLFPYGRGGPDDSRHEIIRNRSSFVQHLLLYHDRRFAHNGPLLFWFFNRMLRHRACGLVKGVPARPSSAAGSSVPTFLSAHDSTSTIRVGDLRDAVKDALAARRIGADADSRRLDPKTRELLSSLTAIANRLPGTALHMQRHRMQLMSLLKAPDLPVPTPTFFFTLSSADLYWPELLRMIDPILDEHAIKTMTSETRRMLLAQNPVLAAQHFHDRYRAVLKYIIKGDAAPFGKVVDHWVRLETQLRGSLHIHGLLWVQEMNDVTQQLQSEKGKQTIASFLDRHVSAMLPSLGLVSSSSSFSSQSPSSSGAFHPGSSSSDHDDSVRVSLGDILSVRCPHESLSHPSVAALLRQQVRAVNYHSRHTFTCYKGMPRIKGKCRPADKCRFRYPRERAVSTTITMAERVNQKNKKTVSMVVDLKRDDPYIVPYSPALTAA